MNRQISLFEEQYIKLSDIYNFVHDMGKWQSQNCYITKATLFKDIVVISNHNTYGTKEEQERCNDSVVLTINDNGYCKINTIWTNEITLWKYEKYPFIRQLDYFQDYLIECDIKLEKCKKVEEQEEEDGNE